jgi:hypothetical protein
MDRMQARSLLDMPEKIEGLHHTDHPYTNICSRGAKKYCKTSNMQDEEEAKASERRAVPHSQGVSRNLGQDASVTSDGGASILNATVFVSENRPAPRPRPDLMRPEPSPTAGIHQQALNQAPFQALHHASTHKPETKAPTPKPNTNASSTDRNHMPPPLSHTPGPLASSLNQPLGWRESKQALGLTSRLPTSVDTPMAPRKQVSVKTKIQYSVFRNPVFRKHCVNI